MTEKWVPEAIAEQEEYIRRISGCKGVSCAPHKFAPMRYQGGELPVPHEHVWSACVHCEVTETREDYARKLAAQTS